MNEIANIILQQLGGGHFLAMTGAQVLAEPNGLIVKLPRISKVSCIVVRLDAGSDTYTIETFKGRGLHFRHLGITAGHYAEDLAPLFTELTGLRTSL